MGNALIVTARTGIVDSVDAEKATVKVKFPDLHVDKDGTPRISNDLQVLRFRSYGDREYWMPDVNEQVFCFFLGTGIEHGFIMGAPYSTEDPPPVTDPNKHHVAYRDETYHEYDRKEHLLKISISGKDFTEDEGEGGAASRDGSGGEGGRGGKLDAFVEQTIDVYAKGNITVKTDENASLIAKGDILVQADGKVDVIAKKDITAKSDANITAEAKGNITAKADGNASVEAQGDIKLKAGGDLDLDAGGAINIKAGGNVTVKGTRINLN